MPSILENDELVKRAGQVIRYRPRGSIRDAFTVKEPELLLDGAAGTGKSRGLLEKLHLCLSKYPGALGFMTRQTRSSMTASCMLTYQREVLKPPDKVKFVKSEQVFYYPNGSQLFVFGMDDEEKAKSSQYDIGYVCEATELTIDGWEMLTTRMRNGVMPYQQILADCNPSFPSHWLKARCDKNVTRLMHTTHRDNPTLYDEQLDDWTLKGKQYLARLETLSGVRRARLYEGLWAAAEGMVYEEWDQSVHMISFNDLPPTWMEWPIYWSVDFGFTHPFVWQEWREDPDGRLYRTREMYMTRRIVEDHVRQIIELSSGLPYPRAIICDHDAEGRATMERYLQIPTLRAYKAIAEGIQAVHARLRSPAPGVKPRMFLVRDALVERDEDLAHAGKPYCTEMEFDSYVYASKKKQVNQRTDEIPEDRDNHGMDALRYIVAFMDNLGIDPQDAEESVFLGNEDYTISLY